MMESKLIEYFIKGSVIFGLAVVTWWYFAWKGLVKLGYILAFNALRAGIYSLVLLILLYTIVAYPIDRGRLNARLCREHKDEYKRTHVKGGSP